jgi:hypothetical protein
LRKKRPAKCLDTHKWGVTCNETSVDPRRYECMAPGAASRLDSYHLDLHGLSLEESEAKVLAMIDDYQAGELENYAILLVDHGGDPADHAAVERLRAKLAENREQLIKNWRAMVILHQAQNDSGRVH